VLLTVRPLSARLSGSIVAEVAGPQAASSVALAVANPNPLMNSLRVKYVLSEVISEDRIFMG
jgi:hypothetical protein